MLQSDPASHLGKVPFTLLSCFQFSDGYTENVIAKLLPSAFRRKVIVVAKETNNLTAARWYGIPKQIYDGGLRAATAYRAAPARHPELGEEVVPFVRDARNCCVAGTAEIVQVKPRETPQQHGLSAVAFRASKHWVQCSMKRSGVPYWRWTSLCQCLPVSLKGELGCFQHYVIGLWCRHIYSLGQIGNADETPM